MKPKFYLLIFPHVEDRRFVELQLQDSERNLLAANVVLATQINADGIREFQLREIADVYEKGQIL